MRDDRNPGEKSRCAVKLSAPKLAYTILHEPGFTEYPRLGGERLRLQLGQCLPPNPLAPFENGPSDIIWCPVDGTFTHGNCFLGLLDLTKPVSFPHRPERLWHRIPPHAGCGGAWDGARRRGRGVRTRSDPAYSPNAFCVGPPPSSISYSR